MHPGIGIISVDSIDSTQRHARHVCEQATSLDGPFAVVAEQQSGGVGQRGRSWVSPAGGLWLTLAWPIAAAPLPDLLALRVGVALMQAVRVATGLEAQRVRLKWPNDLIVDDRKAGGVLIEVLARAAGRVLLVGVGINANVRLEALPEEVRAGAATLQSATGREVDLLALRASVLDELARHLQECAPTGELLEQARAGLWGVGRTLTVTLPGGQRQPALIEGLEDDGRLRVRLDGHVQRLASAIVGA